MTDDKRFTKHGFPKGFRFAPTNLELITILSHKIHGRRLHPKVAGIFHELPILDHHPEELHDQYERDKEHRYIYFFSWRQFQKPSGGGPVHKKRQRGAGGQDEDDNEPRPVRLARGGGWKPSGGGHVLRWPKDTGGFVAGKMVTMVFYDHHHGGEQVKCQWGMHEFTVPVDQRRLSKLTKITRLHDLALYRLYKLKSSDNGAGSSQTLPPNVPAANGHYFVSAPSGQPSFGIFNDRNQPLAAGASTSRMPPQQHHIPNVGHPQFYHHHQYGLGAAPASAAHQMTMPPANGTGLPGRQCFQFGGPPAPAPAPWMPVPPAPHQLQAPSKATYGGAGQQGSHSGGTRSLPLAPVVSAPPPAAERPSAEELAPMTATHCAGQEACGNFGDATGSRPAEQEATATAEAGQHVQFEPEERVPPPTAIEDRIPADNYDDGIGMMAWDIDMAMFPERFEFSMDELCSAFDEQPPRQQEDNN